VAQKFVGKVDTNRVLAMVVGPGVAFAIPIKAGQRICAAGLQGGS
jgi:hypothetical protein